MSNYKEYKLGDVLTRADRFEIREDDKEYTFAGLYSFCRGLFVRHPVKGNTFKLPKIQRIHNGDFVYSKIMAWEGAFSLVKEEAHNTVLSGAFVAYIADENIILTRYLDYYFKIKSVWKSVGSKSTGTNMRRRTLHPKEFEKYIIKLPSVEEQKRLVNILDKIFADLRVLKTELEFSKINVKNLKNSILQQAVQGKLTADWRANNPNSEDASQLLKRIQKEKAQLIAAKIIKKEKPLPKITKVEIPYDLPEGWVWCRIIDVCEKVTDGFHHTPAKLNKGIRYISATHIKENGILWNDCHFIGDKEHFELFRKASQGKGDVLIVNRGAGCGTPAIVDIDEPFSFQNAALIGFNKLYINSNYMNNFILQKRTEIMDIFTNGGAQPMLSNKILKTLLFPFPPIEEQKVIVHKVNALMGLCDRLEQEVQQSQKHSEQLMQSCLREVFEN